MDISTSKPRPRPPQQGNPPQQPARIPQLSSAGTNSELQDPAELRSKTAPVGDSSNKSQSRPRGDGAEIWFNQSNVNPKYDFSLSLQDEPPYFLPKRRSFNGPNRPGWNKERAQHPQIAAFRSRMAQSNNTTTNSTDEYRGVIDDLTVENKRLREENMRLKKSHSSHLAEDRLFEITIHELSPRKRRQLENKLREFAASLDEPNTSDNVKASSEGTSQSHINSSLGQRLIAGSSDSISQPLDSAYNSMSNFGQISSPNLIPAGSSVGNASNQGRQGNATNTQPFLQHLLEDSLPKDSAVLTKRQKKKLVVQRLERLFTGRGAGGLGEASPDKQVLLQQEVSRSAERADNVAGKRLPGSKGVREAHILSKFAGAGSNEDRQPSASTKASNSSSDSPNELSEAEQRPTRPMDLDLNRAQVPSDNMDYIRHLGLQTPHLIGSEDTSDAEQDAHGWVYLNLLISMAQLHTINVTPDFVRHAVQDLSERFQISQDGNKLRWRGGSRGTYLSNDSGLESPAKQPSDDIEGSRGGEKRRKFNETRFATVPVDVQAVQTLPGKSTRREDFHYRPLFNHATSSSEDLHASAGSSGTSAFRDGHLGSRATRSRYKHTWSWASRSGTQSQKRRNDGTMVFYSNARFYTDLSRDRETSPPLPVRGEGGDGFRSQVVDILGCKPESGKPPISRTTSGSILSFRPFKQDVVAWSEGSDSSGSELLIFDSIDDEEPKNRPSSHSNANAPFQCFEVCGLGGIQPADHFVTQVETRRTNAASRILVDGDRRRLSKTSLDTFNGPDPHKSEDFITEKLASLATFASPSPTPDSMQKSELPIKIEYLSERLMQLEPSKLPEAVGYYGSSTDSDDSFQYSESSGVASPVKRHLLLDQSYTKTHDLHTLKWTMEMGDMSQSGSETDDEADKEEIGEEEEDSDSSIDMLAHMRAAYPETVALREREFEAAA